MRTHDMRAMLMSAASYLYWLEETQAVIKARIAQRHAGQ